MWPSCPLPSTEKLSVLYFVQGQHTQKEVPFVLSLPLTHDLAHGNHEFIHILAGVVEGEGGTDAHLVAEGTEGGLGAVVTSTHCDALLI